MNELTLEGWLSVRAALIAGNRDVYQILIQKGKTNSRLDAILKRAKEQKVSVSYVSEDVIEAKSEGKTHGGILAEVGERKFLSLDAIGQGPQAAFLAMLDGVEDPFNFAQALRSLWACGAHGLILRPRNWLSAASTVTRASAGASEFMPTAVVNSDDELFDMLKTKKLKLVCSDLSENAMSPRKANLKPPLLLVIGGEKRGIAKTVLQKADSVLRIPYGRNFKQALGVSGSAAILAYEVMQQRSVNASD